MLIRASGFVPSCRVADASNILINIVIKPAWPTDTGSSCASSSPPVPFNPTRHHAFFLPLEDGSAPRRSLDRSVQPRDRASDPVFANAQFYVLGVIVGRAHRAR